MRQISHLENAITFLKTSNRFILIKLRFHPKVEIMAVKLSQVLTRILKEQNLTLKELAIMTKLKPSTLSGWKNGVSPRSLEEVRLCARALGISMEKLLFDEVSDQVDLEDLMREHVFDGYLKIKIERVIPNKIKRSDK